MGKTDNRYKSIPSLNDLLVAPQAKPLIEKYGRLEVARLLRLELEKARGMINKGGRLSNRSPDWLELVEKRFAKESLERITPVINLSGVVIHTNLGRSILPLSSQEAALQAMQNYVNLEYNLLTGKRGKREESIEKLLQTLTTAEAAIVTNNNTAALLLTLNSLSRKRKVIVSRGELVEIGGSFRLPDLIKESHAKLQEVGTTNKTAASDYLEAIKEGGKLILKVHPSNYKIVGFTESASTKELAKIAKEANIPFVVDLGSGMLIDLPIKGFDSEPTVKQILKDGADLVTFSVDKLLGGPQAGIIAGKKILIDKIKKNNLQRAVRLDKIILAATEATLRLYLDQDQAVNEIPTLRFLTRELSSIKESAIKAKKILEPVRELSIKIVEDYSLVGGGAFPELKLETYSLAISSKDSSPESIAKRFRLLTPAIIGRIEQGLFKLDVRLLDDTSQFQKSVSAIYPR
ncbi:MAG: L-seryl-tRNA(Sec) selenium transferase [Nitrospinota bacterium]